MENTNLTIMELKTKYNLQDTKTVVRIISLKEKIKLQKHKNMNYEELFSFLESIMNFEEMQLWILKKEIKDEKITFNDKLNKLFELKTDENILEKYDINQILKSQKR